MRIYRLAEVRVPAGGLSFDAPEREAQIIMRLPLGDSHLRYTIRPVVQAAMNGDVNLAHVNLGKWVQEEMESLNYDFDDMNEWAGQIAEIIAMMLHLDADSIWDSAYEAMR